MIHKQVGNWVLKGYKGVNNKPTYWVYNLPFYDCMLQFSDLNKAKEIFNDKIQNN